MDGWMVGWVSLFDVPLGGIGCLVRFVGGCLLRLAFVKMYM